MWTFWVAGCMWVCPAEDGVGAWKNPDYLVCFTAAEIPVKVLISPLLLTPNFSREGCFPGRISKFYGNFYRNHREKRQWLVLMSWERRRGAGNSLGGWAGAQQDDETLKTRGKRGVTGGCGVILGVPRSGQHSPRPKYVLCAGETSTVRKRRWPTNRWVAPKVKNAPPPRALVPVPPSHPPLLPIRQRCGSICWLVGPLEPSVSSSRVLPGLAGTEGAVSLWIVGGNGWTPFDSRPPPQKSVLMAGGVSALSKGKSVTPFPQDMHPPATPSPSTLCTHRPPPGRGWALGGRGGERGAGT